MESTLVIKVKYGDTLRRFNSRINEVGQLDLDMAGLRMKILGLFNFPFDADLNLTYVDEDGDSVTLVDDDDLCDVMRQSLKFLRVDVQLNNEKLGKSYARSSGSSTPMRSPRVHNPLPNINTGVSEVIRSVPGSLHEVLSKLSLDLASKAASSNPVLADLVDCFSKMGQSYLNQEPAQRSQVGDDSNKRTGASEISVAVSTPAVPNASKDEVSVKFNSASKTGQEVHNKGVGEGTGAPPVPACVDLNLDPPSDSNRCLSSARKLMSVASLMKEKQNAGHQAGNSVSFAVPSHPLIPVGNRCPLPVTNESSAPPITLSCDKSCKEGSGQFDAVVFHRDVQCDGCGVRPITGPRYKSKVKENYDLCSICFAEMGKETDYIKIERPLTHPRPPQFLKGFHDPSHWLPKPPFSPIMINCGVKPARPKLDSHFILDVNVLDGTLITPSTPFTKIWRMRNSGTVAWPQGARLVWIGGDKFSHADSAELEIPENGVLVDGELDIAVDFISPELPGRYISYWRMSSPSGTKFGQSVWVLIQVDASLKESTDESYQGLNLNLPPEGDGSKAPEVEDINVQPSLGDGFLVPGGSTLVLDPVKGIVDEQSKNDQELNFPINDTLLVGHGVSASASPQLPSASAPPQVPSPYAPPQVLLPVSYPIIDFSVAADSAPKASFDPELPIPCEGITINDSVEKTLLKELEDMGFKQVDLNKEILRMNEYNLEQSVDDLCGVAVWDPILEELQEMGFHDEETNRKLLKKNNGSIKRVVMDLLGGEKA